MIKRALAWISYGFEQIFPFYNYCRFKRRFLNRAEAGDNGESAAYEKLGEDKLEALLKEDRVRGAAIDEKTFKLTLSLTFALTVIGTLSATLLSASESPEFRGLITILLFFVVFYALAAGFVALGAMRTLPTYGLGAPRNLADGAGARRCYLADCMDRNAQISLLRSARNETAYLALRNSFYALFVMLTAYFCVQGLPNVAALHQSIVQLFEEPSQEPSRSQRYVPIVPPAETLRPSR